MVIRGSYYRSGDSVLFQAEIIDVASGRVLRSFDPVGAPVEQCHRRPRGAAGADRGRSQSAGQCAEPGQSRRSRPGSAAESPAYREFVAGLKGRKLDDWEAEAEHYRRAARLDSTFVAPLIQLAFRATWNDECAITDSIGRVLEPAGTG